MTFMVAGGMGHLDEMHRLFGRCCLALTTLPALRRDTDALLARLGGALTGAGRGRRSLRSARSSAAAPWHPAQLLQLAPRAAAAVALMDSLPSLPLPRS